MDKITLLALGVDDYISRQAVAYWTIRSLSDFDAFLFWHT